MNEKLLERMLKVKIILGRLQEAVSELAEIARDLDREIKEEK